MAVRVLGIGLAAALILAGCGASGSGSAQGLAATCDRVFRETESVTRRLIPRTPPGKVVSFTLTPARRRALRLGAREVLAIDRGAEARIRRLAQSAQTRAALANLARNEQALLHPPTSGPFGFVGGLFAYADASGGCRRHRAAISG